MPTHKVEKVELEAIADRLEEYVKAYHAGDWLKFAKAIGVARTTALNWCHATCAPSAAEVLKLARKGIRLDWLFLGIGPMEREPAGTGGSVLEDMRATIRARYQTSAPRPTDEQHVDRTLPPADMLLDLCVEFLRPGVEAHLPQVERLAASARAYRLGDQRDLEKERHENDGFVVPDPTPLATERGYWKVQIEDGYRKILEHMRRRARDGRPAYQFVDDEISLVPWGSGQQAPPIDPAERLQWLRWHQRQLRSVSQAVARQQGGKKRGRSR